MPRSTLTSPPFPRTLPTGVDSFPTSSDPLGLFTPAYFDPRHPLIGIVGQCGDVQARNSTSQFNDHTQLFPDRRPGSQRFRAANETVDWDDRPSDEDYFAVENFFARHGVRVIQCVQTSGAYGARPVRLEEPIARSAAA